MSCIGLDKKSLHPKRAWKFLKKTLSKRLISKKRSSQPGNGFRQVFIYSRNLASVRDRRLIYEIESAKVRVETGGVVDGRSTSYEEDACCSGDEIELEGVDASAEDFIRRMRQTWKLERQESYDNIVRLWDQYSGIPR